MGIVVASHRKSSAPGCNAWVGKKVRSHSRKSLLGDLRWSVTLSPKPPCPFAHYRSRTCSEKTLFWQSSVTSECTGHVLSPCRVSERAYDVFSEASLGIMFLDGLVILERYFFSGVTWEGSWSAGTNSKLSSRTLCMSDCLGKGSFFEGPRISRFLGISACIEQPDHLIKEGLRGVGKPTNKT